MAEDISKILGWAYIGTPAGMQSKRGGCIADFEIGQITDLDNRYIEIYPNTEILCQHWELRNNLPVTYYILYRFAREMNAGRHGAFYGSVLVSVKYELEPTLVYGILSNLADKLGKSLDENQRFKTNITSLELTEPPELRHLSQSLTKLSTISSAAGNSCFLQPNRPYIKNEQANLKIGADFFEHGNRLQASKIYNRVYGSSNPEIVRYVQERKSLKILDFNTLTYELSIEKKNDEISDLSKKLDETKISLVFSEVQFHDLKVQSDRLEQDFKNKILNLENQLSEAQRTMPAGVDREELATQFKASQSDQNNLQYVNSSGSAPPRSNEHNSPRFKSFQDQAGQKQNFQSQSPKNKEPREPAFQNEVSSQDNRGQKKSKNNHQHLAETPQKGNYKTSQEQIPQRQSDRKKSEKNRDALNSSENIDSNQVKYTRHQFNVFWLHYRVYIFAGLVLISLSCFLAYNEYPDLFNWGSKTENASTVKNAVTSNIPDSSTMHQTLSAQVAQPASVSDKNFMMQTNPVSSSNTFSPVNPKVIINQGVRGPFKTSDDRVLAQKADLSKPIPLNQGVKKSKEVVSNKESDVKIMTYTVQKGDYSLAIILKHINKLHLKVSSLSKIEIFFGPKDAITKDHKFKAGEKLYYSVPASH